MGLAKGIRKHGFRNWYERTLLGSHGWLVLTLLGAFGAFGALESLLGSDTWADRAGFALGAFAAGAVTVWTLQRFLRQLVRAQKAATQATCPQCQAYGRLEVVGESRDQAWVRVRCRACSHEWMMDDG